AANRAAAFDDAELAGGVVEAADELGSAELESSDSADGSGDWTESSLVTSLAHAPRVKTIKNARSTARVTPRQPRNDVNA
ncbi:MAG: hypothetical protein ABI345_09350, partial [Jatrophihabitans sp.]